MTKIKSCSSLECVNNQNGHCRCDEIRIFGNGHECGEYAYFSNKKEREAYLKRRYSTPATEVDPIVKLAEAAKAFLTIDDRIHSTPYGGSWEVVDERAKRYTQARKELFLMVRDILAQPGD